MVQSANYECVQKPSGGNCRFRFLALAKSELGNLGAQSVYLTAEPNVDSDLGHLLESKWQLRLSPPHSQPHRPLIGCRRFRTFAMLRPNLIINVLAMETLSCTNNFVDMQTTFFVANQNIWQDEISFDRRIGFIWIFYNFLKNHFQKSWNESYSMLKNHEHYAPDVYLNEALNAKHGWMLPSPHVQLTWGKAYCRSFSF